MRSIQRPILRPIVPQGALASLGTVGYRFVNSEAAAIAAVFDPAPTDARKALIDAWWTTVKAAGLGVSSFNRLYVTAAAASQNARVDWANPGSNTLALFNSPVFVTDRGFTGDGAAAYLDPSFVPSTDGGSILTLNGGHVGAWKTLGTSTTGGLVSVAGAGATLLVVPVSGGNCLTRANSSGLTSVNASSTTGHFIGVRTSNVAEQQYINGTGTASSGALSATSLDARSAVFLRSNTSYSTDVIGAAHIGASLTGAQVTALKNAFLTYMQAIGAA